MWSKFSWWTILCQCCATASAVRFQRSDSAAKTLDRILFLALRQVLLVAAVAVVLKVIIRGSNSKINRTSESSDRQSNHGNGFILSSLAKQR